MAKLKQITVKGSGDDRKVVLWEKNESHPNGEAFIPNDGKSYTVAETPFVRRLLADGSLVTGDEPVKTEAKAKEEVKRTT